MSQFSIENTEFIQIRKNLLLQKSSILNKHKEFKSEQTNSSTLSGDEAEIASQDLSLTVSIHLHERDRESLLMIEKALEKIESGKYGLCENCGEHIQPKRLVARPFTPLCIDCMEEHEDPRFTHFTN